MLMIFLILCSLRSLNAEVSLGENDQGKIIYIYEHDDHKNVEAALVELLEYREKFPLLKEDRDKLIISRQLWKDLNDQNIKEIRELKIQKNILIGGIVVTTVVALILGVFK